MAIRSELIGTSKGGTIHSAAVKRKNGFEPALVVLTEPLREVQGQFVPFLNSEVGNNMAVNAAVGGTPVVIHDGGDSSAWAGTNVIGSSVDFASGAEFFAGSASVRINSPALSDVWQFDKGSDLDVTSYTALSMQVRVNRRWTAGDSVSIYCWDTGGAVQIGASVLLEDYIDEFSFDVWQGVAIPFTDLGLTTTNFDAIRMELVGANVQTPDFFIDSFQVEQTGSPVTFHTTTPQGFTYWATNLVFTFIGPLAATLLNGTTPALTWDQLLGTSKLTNGIVLTRTVDGKVTFAPIFRCLADFLSTGFKITNLIGDGTDVALTLEQTFVDDQLILYGGTNSRLSVTISDDLSGLHEVKVAVRGTISTEHTPRTVK